MAAITCMLIAGITGCASAANTTWYKRGESRSKTTGESGNFSRKMIGSPAALRRPSKVAFTWTSIAFLADAPILATSDGSSATDSHHEVIHFIDGSVGKRQPKLMAS